MFEHINAALNILSDIFSSGYSGEVLRRHKVGDMSTRLTYGVLENNVKIEYILRQLVERKPQKTVFIILKIGVYALISLDNVPDYAIVSECVEVAKARGKAAASGMINAVLKRVARGEYTLPTEGDDEYLSVNFSVPQWFCNRLCEEFGTDVAIKILAAPKELREHIRPNLTVTCQEKIYEAITGRGEAAETTSAGGCLVELSDFVRGLFRDGQVTVQAPSSMLAAEALAKGASGEILDLCAAPGGKAVYMSELAPEANICAAELYPHRINLMESYIKRMRAKNIRVVKNDATILNEEWVEKFDRVLVDAPCSAFGTYKKHPDVFLTKGEEDISKLAEIQKSILDRAAEYVKKGGYILYSTCTLFREENALNATYLAQKGFEAQSIRLPDDVDTVCDEVGGVQILPTGAYDGFYMIKLRRSK